MTEKKKSPAKKTVKTPKETPKEVNKSHIEYISKYVRISPEGGSEAASYLTHVLNDLSKEGWQIIRTELVQGGFGYLIIAIKQPQITIEDIIRQSIGASGGEIPVIHLGGNPSRRPSVDLSNESRSFLNEFMANNKYTGERLLEKAGETLAPVLKKYSSTQLRPLIENMKAYVTDHLANHEGPPCEISKIIQRVIELTEHHVFVSMS